MKKTLIAAAIALGMGANSTHAADVTMNNSTFTMFDGTGALVGTPDTTVTGAIDSAANTWNVTSTTTFFGLTWTAHDGTTFGPGSYSIDTCNPGATTNCGTYTNLTVNTGQVGGHILFDWGSTFDIDVILVWDIVSNGNGTVTYTSTDASVGATGALPATVNPFPVQPDGILGTSMIDGAFPAFNANFDFTIPSPPVANNDSRSTPIDTPITIDVVANDSAAATTNGDTAAATPAIVPPASLNVPANTAQGGTLADNGNGSVDYTPPLGYSGPDSFTYTLTDDAGRVSAAATVSITVTVVANTPPVANGTTVTADEGSSVNIGVNSVATDGDGDNLTFATFDATSAEGGSVTADGTSTTLTYTPAADFNGTDSFTIAVTDGIDNSNVVTITVNVNPVNDPLVCTDVTLAAGLDTPLNIDVATSLLSTCSDPDGDTITLDSTTQPSQSGSTLSFDGANTLTYTPASGFQGQDSFTYTASDGTTTDTKTVLVNVTGKIFGNFTMVDTDGVTFGGTNDIVFDWDGTCYNSVAEADAGVVNMTMGSDSSFPFFGFPWVAHDIKVFCPGGPYVFDTCNDASVPASKCGPLSMTVPAGHLGAHILFNWNVTADIDVAVVWENTNGGTWQNVVPTGQLYQGPTGPTPALDEFYDWISVDADGDGVPGIQFVDGPFIDFRANFNFKTTAGGGGNVVIPETSVSSPDLGKGCTIARAPISVFDRGDWLVLSGFMVWLGIGANRRFRRTRHQP